MTTKKPDAGSTTSWISGARMVQAPAQQGIDNPKMKGKREAKSEDTKRKRFTVNLAADLIEWARRATVFTPGQSLSGLVEEALTRELKRLEKARGEAFPSTTATPKKGRPIVLKDE